MCHSSDRPFVSRALRVCLLSIALGTGALGSAACSLQPEVAVAKPVNESRPVAVQAGEQLSVRGSLVPRSSVELKFQIDGTVGEVLVKEGDQIRSGAVLARLDGGDLRLSVDRAKANVSIAKAAYEKLVEGAMPEEIAAAQSQVDEAKGMLQQTEGAVSSVDIAAAETRLASAQAALAALERGPNTSDVNAAQARLQGARAALAQIEAGPKASLVNAAQARLDQAREGLKKAASGPNPSAVKAAQANLDQVRATIQTQNDALSNAKTTANSEQGRFADNVRLAQEAYSSAFWDLEQATAGRDPRTGRSYADANIDAEAQKHYYAEQLRIAEIKLRQSETELAQAIQRYDQAFNAEITGIAAGEAAIREAEASLERILTIVDAEAIAVASAEVASAEAAFDGLVSIDPAMLEAARAAVASAQAELDKLLRIDPAQRSAAVAAVATAQAELDGLRGGERQGSIAAAAANVLNAESVMEQLAADPSKSDLATALAEIEQAEVDVKMAERSVTLATLQSPIAGTIAELRLKPGEVYKSIDVAVIVADFGQWYVETTDLSELSIAQVSEGDAAGVSFDALPGVELTGKVLRIEPIGNNVDGDTTYTVVIVLDDPDPRLRWNMSAAVTLMPE